MTALCRVDKYAQLMYLFGIVTSRSCCSNVYT